jgi:hypothetical protein
MITGSITYDKVTGSIVVSLYTVSDPEDVPANALLTEDGYPLFDEDGNYILIDT